MTISNPVQGRTIELADDLGIEGGQGVEVMIQTIPAPDPRIEAILRTAGSMAQDPEFAAIMDQVAQLRSVDPACTPVP